MRGNSILKSTIRFIEEQFSWSKSVLRWRKSCALLVSRLQAISPASKITKSKSQRRHASLRFFLEIALKEEEILALQRSTCCWQGWSKSSINREFWASHTSPSILRNISNIIHQINTKLSEIEVYRKRMRLQRLGYRATGFLVTPGILSRTYRNQ